MTRIRLDYRKSILRLQELRLLQSNELPPMLDRMPQPFDEVSPGLGFYKTLVSDADLSNLTIPRTFFGRSEIKNVGFQNSDLSESNLRWNDFVDIDFTSARLTGADLRASLYTRVNFTRADLRGADMRMSDFENCIFEHATMDGAVLTRKRGKGLALSAVQQGAIAWCDDDGPTPTGG
jgi:uncharacterized protein YjbI with pentapeptide repeats